MGTIGKYLRQHNQQKQEITVLPRHFPRGNFRLISAHSQLMSARRRHYSHRISVQIGEVIKPSGGGNQVATITHAKGGKQRYVPLLPDLTHELRTYLREHTTGPLFVTMRHTRYSPRRIQQLVQETAALAGITKRVHPHLLRHSVATTLLERGMPLEQIQQFLGHAKLETTQIYAASTTVMIKESYQKALGR